MQIIDFSLQNLPQKETNLSLALGNFDGFHKGHQKLFVETSLHASGVSAALLFDEPFFDGPYLSSLEDKKRYALLSRLDALYVLHDAKQIYAMTPNEFATQVLIPLGTKRVVVGEDFRFGKGGCGTPEDLKPYFEVSVIPLLRQQNEKVSSSAVKSALFEGDVTKAEHFLGRPYEICGYVEEGYHNGEKIGYPTLNIHSKFPYVLPKTGVYAGAVYVSGIARKAMINVGTNPTIGRLVEPRIEAHLLDFDQDCYGKLVYCDFLAFVREEKKFASLDELRHQLALDEAAIRDLLA